MLVDLCIDHSIRHVGRAELSIYNSDRVDLRARHIYCAVLQEKLALDRIQGGMLDSRGEKPIQQLVDIDKAGFVELARRLLNKDFY